MALKADGTVVGWGTYWDGTGYVPMTAPEGLTDVTAISAGGNHCLALVGDGPPALKAAASGVEHSEGKLSLALPTQSGRVYRLERADSASATNWASLPIEPGNGTIRTLSDSSATNAVQFYRVRRW